MGKKWGYGTLRENPSEKYEEMRVRTGELVEKLLKEKGVSVPEFSRRKSKDHGYTRPETMAKHLNAIIQGRVPTKATLITHGDRFTEAEIGVVVNILGSLDIDSGHSHAKYLISEEPEFKKYFHNHQ